MRPSSPHILDEHFCTFCSDFQSLITIPKRLGKQVHHLLGPDQSLSFRGTSHDKSASATSGAVNRYEMEHTTMFVKRLRLCTLSYLVVRLTPNLMELVMNGLQCSALRLKSDDMLAIICTAMTVTACSNVVIDEKSTFSRTTQLLELSLEMVTCTRLLPSGR